MRIALCPGSFDPITLGHLDIIERAVRLYDKVIVGVVENPNKSHLFSTEERVEMVTTSLVGMEKVEVSSFNGLLVEFAREHQVRVIIKGLRAISDFEHEFQMAHLNKKLASELETVFMMASPEYMFLSSSAVKEIALFGGSVAGLVPDNICFSLKNKLNKP
ncbi:MAG TPA: pantetheine-phosphate adenylyltransferase [Actinobacteria bacterium]|nr:pantetheine-phosphate adenylyltransferase [Actinomycetes bacterium]HEX21529.1 pantetheine-phosphate adenylyltransferase [Actinomycetota bacterium]